MKKLLPMIGLLAVMGAGQAEAKGQGNNAPSIVSSLRTIRSNATEASQNARIYQWMRVNREVDRIVAAERRLRRELGVQSEKANALQTLQQAIKTLRTARITHNIEEIQQASEQIITQCDVLLK